MTPPRPAGKVRVVVGADGGVRVGVPERWLRLFEGGGSGRKKRDLEGCGKCGKKGIYPVVGGVKEGTRACSLEHLKALKGV